QIQPVMQKEQLLHMQETIETLYVDQSVKRYIIDIVSATRQHSYVQLGVSPRVSISLMKAAKAYAFIQNREFVIPDDIKYLAPYVLPHRIILRPEARYEGITQHKIIHDILETISVPVRKELPG